jgi:hypothetical protein
MVGDIAFADRIRYHMNVFWENAPDRRTSRTLDWINDACEAQLDKGDRHRGEVTYIALMSPVSIAASGVVDLRHPLTQANRAGLRPTRKKYTGKYPISLLLTTGLAIEGETKEKAPPYVLFGTKKWRGSYAAVGKYRRNEVKIARDAAEQAADPPPPYEAESVDDGFLCKIRISKITIDVTFATRSEADVLIGFLESEPQPKVVAAESGS